jgi:hypothetical protein
MTLLKTAFSNGAMTLPSGASRVAFVLSLLALVSCGRSRPDFGTMPRVEVPIEKQPAQDPTLFRDAPTGQQKITKTDPPDPEPLRTKDHFDYLLEFNKGKVTVISSRAVQLEQPESTPRKIGRFAFELWTGAQLVDRVRFEFPLLGAGNAHDEDVIGKGLSARTSIRVPSSARATMARIIDRKTREEVIVPWPPESAER